MTRKFTFFMILPVFLSIFISIFFIPIFSNISQSKFSLSNTYTSSIKFTYNNSPSNLAFSTNISKNYISTSNILWPTPGYTKITSKFGYRTAPTTGAGTYHGGIDIAAPENSSIISILDGTVSFIGWNGANGYTVIIQHSNNLKSIYGHVSPNFLVSVGDSVKKGQLIARVGPKYVEPTNYTTYTDKNGIYTNGATTGPHLHFSLSDNGKKINPETLYY